MGKLEDDLQKTLKAEDDAKAIKRVIKHLKDESLPTKMADTTNKVDKERVLDYLNDRAEKEIRMNGLKGKLSDLAETPLNSENPNANELTHGIHEVSEQKLHRDGVDLADIETKTKTVVDEIDADKARKEEKLNKLIDRMGARDLDDPTMGE